MTCYEEGWTAYQQGEDARKCPYTDQARREAWLRGWHEAEQNFRES